jgi:hypothetical protein
MTSRHAGLVADRKSVQAQVRLSESIDSESRSFSRCTGKTFDDMGLSASLAQLSISVQYAAACHPKYRSGGSKNRKQITQRQGLVLQDCSLRFQFIESLFLPSAIRQVGCDK